MSAATEQLARQAIEAVAQRIGDLEPDSVRVAAVGGGAHLGIKVPMGTLDSMVQNFGGLYDGELNPYWRGKLDGAAIHVFASGSVRVPSAPSREAAVAAYEQVRGAVFRLRNEALPDVPPIKWYAIADADSEDDDLDDAASLASMPPPTASERSRAQKRGWAQMRSQVTRDRNAAVVDDEMQTSTGDESLAMSTRSNTSTWDAERMVKRAKGWWAYGQCGNSQVITSRFYEFPTYPGVQRRAAPAAQAAAAAQSAQ